MAKAIKSVNPNTGIKGMDIMLSNLNKEIKNIEGRIMKGLIESAIIIRRSMDEVPPLIPVDTDNLRGFWFTETIKDEKLIGLVMGFSANYAIFVHEMLDSVNGKKINWGRPNSGAKFLEASLKRNTELILKTIRDNVEIK
jgi:hypothetical protein